MDDRKSIVIPDCPSCQHFSDHEENGKFCCDAFPDGIPHDYFWGPVMVTELSECRNGYKFEEIRD